MGAPTVSSAILTMSIARTTPAQKPRGLSNKTLFWLGEVSAWVPFEMEAKLVVVTPQVYQPADRSGRESSEPYVRASERRRTVVHPLQSVIPLFSTLKPSTKERCRSIRNCPHFLRSASNEEILPGNPERNRPFTLKSMKIPASFIFSL